MKRLHRLQGIIPFIKEPIVYISCMAIILVSILVIIFMPSEERPPITSPTELYNQYTQYNVTDPALPGDEGKWITDSNSNKIVGDIASKQWAHNGRILHKLDLKQLEVLSNKTKGEELQAVLKEERKYTEMGANDKLVESFLTSSGKERAGNLARTLSYIRSDVPLNSQSVQALMDWYSNPDSTYTDPEKNMLKLRVLNTLSMSGDKGGVSFVIDQLEKTQDEESWLNIVGILGKSASEDALYYLHDLLNDLGKDANATEKEKAQVQQAIRALKKTIPAG